MNWEDVTFSSDFLMDIEIKVSYLINIPEKGILERKVVDLLQWSFFPNELSKRWKWYFRYRAALLQVKYPKYDVELKYSTSDMKSERQEINLLERKITAKRRKVTEYFNKAEMIREKHSELFPLEDNPIYLRLKNIEIKKRQELESLEKELEFTLK